MFYTQILLPGPVHTQSICHSFSMGGRFPFDLPLISCNGEQSSESRLTFFFKKTNKSKTTHPVPNNVRTEETSKI